VHIENSQKPNEDHPGPSSYEDQVSSFGQFGRKLLRQPIVVGALRPTPATVAAPIIVQAQPQFQPQPVQIEVQPQYQPQPQIEVQSQPQIEAQPQPQVEVRPQLHHPRPRTVYLSPTQHFLQYEHGYFHRK